jgi:hypothetical protein
VANTSRFPAHTIVVAHRFDLKSSGASRREAAEAYEFSPGVQQDFIDEIRPAMAARESRLGFLLKILNAMDDTGTGTGVAVAIQRLERHATSIFASCRNVAEHAVVVTDQTL